MLPLRCVASATTPAKYLANDGVNDGGGGDAAAAAAAADDDDDYNDAVQRRACHSLNLALDAYPFVLLNTSGTKTFFCGATPFIYPSVSIIKYAWQQYRCR
jgi:hypothetical protein